MTTPNISGRDNVLAALNSSDLAVAPMAPPSDEVGLAWLRASVARFSRGSEHAARRSVTEAVLDEIQPDQVRATARTRARAVWAADPDADIMTAVARRVPVEVLAEALGIAGSGVAGESLVDDVAIVARNYLTGEPDPDADVAVRRLLTAVGGAPDAPNDRAAARVGVLVQSYAATANLIGNAARALAAAGTADEAIAKTIVADPPTVATRRQALLPTHVGVVHIGVGETVVVDLTEFTFGAGPHACPGRAHAIAIAAGVLDALAERSTVAS